MPATSTRRALRSRVVAHVAPQEHERERTGHEVHVEDPRPRQVVDQNAAQRRADRRPENRAEREDRLAHAELRSRKRIAQHDLRRREQSAAERALQRRETESARSSEVAIPQSIDASVNPAIDARK